MKVYSHTSLKTFEQCPLKYKFQYLDRIETKIENIEAFLGRRVHEVLRKLYADLLAGKLDTLEESLAFYGSTWNQNWNPHVRVVRRNATASEYFNYGEECVRNFYHRNYPFSQSQTLHLEHIVEFDLDSEGVRKVRGYVDRVALRPDGTFEIHDFKTGRKVPTQNELEGDRQLGLYQMACKLNARKPRKSS